MNIHELDSFKLSDAIKFNDELNPKIWLPSGEMRPEVRQNLLSIAEDFQDFLGIPNLRIKDITVSGSNAAYTYTPHSDVDLHLVVEFPEGSDEIYRELFDAKKYQYNDEHDFRIGNYDVELYVQDADQEHISQGIFSVKNNDWLSLPKREANQVDDISVRSKYEDMGSRIEAAIKTGDLERMDAIATKVRELRQSGLDKAGEFSPENLAFKALRSTGVLDQLRKARHEAKSQALSLKERERAPVVRERVKYAYGAEVQEAVTVSEPASVDLETHIKQFAEHCVDYLEIQSSPKLQFKRDPVWSQRNGTFGRFTPEINRIELAITGRHPVDIMRTLAHEYTHAKQHEVEGIPDNGGETGSVYEDEANAMAGRIMRHWVEKHPEYFEQPDLEEGVRDKLAAAAAAACIAGTPGCATTGADAIRTVQDVGRTAQTMRGYGSAGAREEAIQLMKNELRRRQGHVVPESVTDEDYDPNGTPPGPETKPTMPAGTVKVDVSDVYDWYKLGQHISNLKGLGQHDFGSGPPSAIISFGDEDTEHKYIQDLEKTGLTTTDIDPVDPNQSKSMPRQKTDPTYNVDEDKQSVDEAQISKNIQPALAKKGYKFLGKGQDQDAYLAPDGTVLKIFGWGTGGELFKGQQSFKDFADYCMAHPNNPFLPQFGGWQPFDFEGKRYLQIKCERMFDLGKSGLHMIGARLYQLASLVEAFGADRGVNKFLRRYRDEETGKLVSLIGGKQQFLLLANTIEQLAKLASKKGYRLDLHGGNFMIGSDGEIVINDPFFTGSWRFDESINEAFNQPYKLKWERGDHGDVDAVARMDDGNYLSIMFNKGYSQGTKEEAWSVEFFRNNSQEVTGEGDAQRVFATVLSAIQTFIKKYKPNRVIFSASKEVEQGQNAQSRAKLYDSLVQRYARAWGFRAFRADTGDKVIYELNRRQPVAEASGYIPVNDKEARDPRYSMAITQDIKPGEVQRQAKKMGWTTDAAGNPPLLMQELERKWKIIKESRSELLEQSLFEINMSPKNLRQEAAKTGALAGMEFEMIVPGAAQQDDDSYPDADYDYNEGISSIQDAFHFFYDGDYNSRNDAQRLVDRMRDDYNDWLGGQLEARWDSDQTEVVYRWLRNNADENDIAEILGKEFDEENEISKQDFKDAADKVIEDNIDPWYDDAYQDFSDDFYNDTDLEEEWLQDEDINTMQDVESNYNITWPHYYNSNSDPELSVDDVADDFSRMINKPVNASQSYHGARREAGHYVVEPDGSLEPDDSDDGGLEFVSPPMPIDEMISDLNKVKAWADRKGCYTNDSTGLHINISVPDFSMDKLDYVKLALLLGDEYVLKQFGRLGNTYTKSALSKVRDKLSKNPEAATELLDKMKSSLGDLASKIVHSGITDKYTSINTKTGYIEFRSPGGDWLDANFDKIENTLLRFTVALSAALNPEAYRKEYLTKLYKLLNPEGQTDEYGDMVEQFSKYVTALGGAPEQVVKDFRRIATSKLQQANLAKKIEKDPTSGQKYWWSVGRPGYGASAQVVATSKKEAIEKGKIEYPDWARAMDVTAKPIRPYVDDTAQQPAQQQSTGSQSRYEIYRISDGRTVEHNGQPLYVNATNPDDAEERARQIIAAANLGAPQLFDVRSVLQAPAQTPVPGSTQDLQQQRAQGGFTGAWRVVDGLGREVYRFSGIGNSQSDANRVGAEWMRQNGRGGNFEVYPIMS